MLYVYRQECIISWGKIFVVFVVEHWTTNILPTNEATLPTFTSRASNNHEYKLIYKPRTIIAKPRIFWPLKITRYTVCVITTTDNQIMPRGYATV